MPERLKPGNEHSKAGEVVDEAFEKGDLQTLDVLKKHTHPAVRERYFSGIMKIVKQHPALAIAVTLGVGAALIGVRRSRTNEKSEKRALEEFVESFKDPLSTSFKETCQIGEMVIGKGLGEQFISNLCASSLQHTQEAERFWGSLNPFHPIFNELLDPQSERTDSQFPPTLPLSHPRNPHPKIHSKYQPMINDMISRLKSDPFPTTSGRGKEIEKAINGKLKNRPI